MNLKQRFFLLGLLFVAFTALVAHTLNAIGEEMQSRRRQIEFEWEARSLAENIERHLNDLDEWLDAPAKSSSRDADGEATQALAGLTASVRRLQDHLGDLQRAGLPAAARSSLETLSLSVASLSESLGTPGLSRRTLADARHASADAALQRARAALTTFTKPENSLSPLHLDAMAGLENRMFRAIGLLFFGSVGAVVLTWAFMGAWVFYPLRLIRRAVRRFTRRRLPTDDLPDGGSEMGQLGREFLAMSRELATFTAELEDRVTARTRELDASRRQLLLMLDRIPDAVSLVDSSGVVLSANEGYFDLFGDEEKSRLPEIMKSDRSARGHFRWTDPAGRSHLLDIRLYPIVLEGNPEGSVVLEYIREVTRQVEMEAALASSQKLVALGRLTSGIAHEINNPLTAIAASAEALVRRLAAGETRGDLFEEYLKIIHDEVFRCKELTEKLLDVSRQREEKMELVAVGDVVADTLRLTEHLRGPKGITVASESHGNDEVFSNPRALRQMFLNLVMNAHEACAHGGRIEVAIHDAGPEVEIRFRDDGRGISEEDLGQLFEPFFTRRRDNTGTGLGLFISQGLIQALGGSISATSDGPGRGACFSVRVPRRRAAQPSGEPALPRLEEARA